jgi:hypothetical protein
MAARPEINPRNTKNMITDMIKNPNMEANINLKKSFITYNFW